MKITFSAPRQIDENTVKTGATISYVYFHPASFTVYMDGGSLSETVLLDGLTQQQKQSVEDFIDLLKTLTQNEVENDTSKTKVRQDAERINQEKKD